MNESLTLWPRNICAAKAKLRLSLNSAPNHALIEKGDVRKKVPLAVLEPTSATLLIALTIGFGIAVHPDGLPAIIENLQARGFHFVTISKLLESPAEPH